MSDEVCLFEQVCELAEWAFSPRRRAAHRVLVAGPSLTRVPTISGWGRGRAVTQLEIGHYLNSRLLRAEILRWQARCEAPLGGRSVCSLRVAGPSQDQSCGAGGDGPVPAHEVLVPSRSTYTVLISSACSRLDCDKV